MELFEPAAVILLVCFGVWQLGAAVVALRMPLAVLRLPRRKVAELAEGQASVEGQLVGLSAMPSTLDGIAAVAIESRLHKASSWTGERASQVWADVAISDGTGSFAVDLDGVLLLGEARRSWVDSERVAALCPGLWAKCSDADKARPRMLIEQRFVRAGNGFVAGEVAPGLKSAGEHYRGAPAAALVIGSGVGLPLLVAGGSKGAVARFLLGPSFLHLTGCLLAFGLAAIVLALDRAIMLRAGVLPFWP